MNFERGTKFRLPRLTPKKKEIESETQTGITRINVYNPSSVRPIKLTGYLLETPQETFNKLTRNYHVSSFNNISLQEVEGPNLTISPYGQEGIYGVKYEGRLSEFLSILEVKETKRKEKLSNTEIQDLISRLAEESMNFSDGVIFNDLARRRYNHEELIQMLERLL
jgi:hypothetical protein